jgi:hypothetical protein
MRRHWKSTEITKMSNERKVVELPDGFNGATMAFYADPVEVDGQLIKLQCAIPGKEHLIRWARQSDLT